MIGRQGDPTRPTPARQSDPREDPDEVEQAAASRRSTVRHIVISGGRSSGKSTVGVHLAHLVHRPFLDLDEDEGNNGPDRLSRLLDARHPTVITTYPESFEALADGGCRHADVAFVWLAHHEPDTPPTGQPAGAVDIVIDGDASVQESVDEIIATFELGPAGTHRRPDIESM